MNFKICREIGVNETGVAAANGCRFWVGQIENDGTTRRGRQMNQLGKKPRCLLEIVIFVKGNHEVVVEAKSLRRDRMKVNLAEKILKIGGG